MHLTTNFSLELGLHGACFSQNSKMIFKFNFFEINYRHKLWCILPTCKISTWNTLHSGLNMPHKIWLILGFKICTIHFRCRICYFGQSRISDTTLQERIVYLTSFLNGTTRNCVIGIELRATAFGAWILNQVTFKKCWCLKFLGK
jgi:hypothetical protein